MMEIKQVPGGWKVDGCQKVYKTEHWARRAAGQLEIKRREAYARFLNRHPALGTIPGAREAAGLPPFAEGVTLIHDQQADPAQEQRPRRSRADRLLAH